MNPINPIIQAVVTAPFRHFKKILFVCFTGDLPKEVKGGLESAAIRAKNQQIKILEETIEKLVERNRQLQEDVNYSRGWALASKGVDLVEQIIVKKYLNSQVNTTKTPDDKAALEISTSKAAYLELETAIKNFSTDKLKAIFLNEAVLRGAEERAKSFGITDEQLKSLRDLAFSRLKEVAINE